MNKQTISLLFFLIFLLIHQVQASVTPGKQWFTLHSPNFHVHHTKPQTEFAKKFSQHLEEALPILVEELSWVPSLPIDIVINDQSDAANGFALSVPANRIEVYPVTYNQDSSLMEYHDWVRELAIHELTHIIANDTYGGFWTPFRYIFGSIVKPNIFQPRWIVEGLAVYMETEYSKLGRGRSAFTEALFRTAVRRKKLNTPGYLRFDQLNDGAFWWPQGTVPYLVGYAIQANLESYRKQNPDRINAPVDGDKSHSIAGMISRDNARMVPYFLNSNLYDITGLSWNQAWNDLVDALYERYEFNDTLNQTCGLTLSGGYSGSIRYHKNGYLYFVAEHPKLGRTISRIKETSDCLEDRIYENPIDPGSSPNYEILAEISSREPVQIDISKDGKKIVYTDSHLVDTYNKYNDIYLLDTTTGSSEQLTQNLRARDPVFSQNQQKVVYVRQHETGIQTIEQIDLISQKRLEVFKGKSFARISSLTIHDKSLYFSYHNNAGQEEIMRIPYPLPRNQLAERVIPWKNKGKVFFERHPFLTSDGSIYYTAHYPTKSGRGKYEVYRLPANGAKPVQITDSLSGMVMWPIIANNKLYTAEYGLSGFYISRREKVSTEKIKTPVKESLHEYLKDKDSEQTTEISANATGINDIETKTSPYSSFSSPATSMFPQFWLPFFSFSETGYFLGAMTFGSDPLEFHNYSLQAIYDSRANFPLYGFSYLNKKFHLQFGLNATQNNNFLTGPGISNREATFSAYLAYPWYYWYLLLGGGYQEKAYFDEKSRAGFGFLGVNYSNTDKSPTAVEYNSGYTFQNQIRYYPKARDEVTFTEYKGQIGFFTSGLSRSHSISLLANGGFTTNRFLSSNYFLGGGLTGIYSGSFIVRGYPRDSLLGQRITTLNFSYSFPLMFIHRGAGIHPLFFRSIGASLRADAGTANFTAIYNDTTFIQYKSRPWGQKILPGVGVDVFLDMTLFYYVPTRLILSAHHGFRKEFGGQTFVFVSFVSSLLGLY